VEISVRGIVFWSKLKSLGATNLCLGYAPAKCGKFDVSQYFFQFRYRYLEIWHLLFVPYHIVRKRIAKVTDFLSFCPFGISMFPFLTIGISINQKRILPYFIIPYLFTPSWFPFGEFWTDRFQISHPFHPYFFLFSTERAGPYPQAQLYWAGRTMGWMADWTSFGGVRHKNQVLPTEKTGHKTTMAMVPCHG